MDSRSIEIYINDNDCDRNRYSVDVFYTDSDTPIQNLSRQFDTFTDAVRYAEGLKMRTDLTVSFIAGGRD